MAGFLTFWGWDRYSSHSFYKLESLKCIYNKLKFHQLSISFQSSESSESSESFLRISTIHHNMAHFISKSIVKEYWYSIGIYLETSSLRSPSSGTKYHSSICSRSSQSSPSL